MKVGIVLSPSSTAHGTRRYAEIWELALQAEALGLDSLWVFDHLFARFPPDPLSGSWEGWTLLTALAEATQRVQLGSLVLSVPFRNPVLLAKMAATVDETSNGRLILGLGAGWHRPEFDAMGIPFGARADRFEEALQIICPLLREGRITYDGTYYRAIEAEIMPRGPRPSGPPVLIRAFRSRMLRLAARYADMWNTAWYGYAGDALRQAQEAVRVACREEGRDPSTLVMTAGIIVSEPNGESGRTLYGTPEEISVRLRNFEEAGIAHGICELEPLNEETVGHLGHALQIFHRGR
ncbi:MAG TPA: LLM class flavin-dependent oxidoreductase [Chloroflexota bacterium]|nr:LLM class flavin-dependent oxidoreductase [Chloroflexota bacterium]